MTRLHGLSVIYDGSCGFCIRSLKFIKAVDLRKRLVFYDFHQKDEIQRHFPLLVNADFESAMYVVTSSGKTYRGFFGFRRLALGLPLLWMFLPLFYFPGASWIGPRVYAWIARNRKSLGCKSEVCEIPQRRL